MSRKVRIGILIILFLLALVVFFWLQLEDKKSQDTFSQIQDIANFTQENLTNDNNSPDTIINSSSASYHKGLSEFSYAQLYEMNNHFMGWINIPDTSVNYPVMQNKDEKDYYLYKDFYQKYSSYGVPYIDERYDINSSNNLLIYGHSMSNSTMFSDLLKFKSQSFYNQTNTIQYNDPNGYHEYKIFSIFEIGVEDNFDYHNYINMDEALFDEFVSYALSYSLYNTNIVPSFGDELITLSTCSTNEDDIRCVVIGVKIS